MINNYPRYFGGRTLIQRSGSIGGARSVFVKLQGIKNELVFPTFGGKVLNPFKGNAKMYAGDLAEYRTVGEGNGTILLLKTYKVDSVSGNDVTIINDGFSHQPFVGDKLIVSSTLATSAGISGNVTNVSKVTENGVKKWKVTIDNSIGASQGSVLVEADTDDTPLVKNPNTILPWDMDFYYSPAEDDNDFEGARYFLTPALHGVMYEHKMSAIPPYVKSLNKSRIVGWFEL